jgi:endonuclease/exonuclease/phosphatase family metal-dependent hydrolase
MNNISRLLRTKINSVFKGHTKCLYFKPKKSVIQSKSDLNVISWNVNGLFLYYNKYRWNSFLNDIGDMFIKKKTDVLCLQEVWEESTLTKLLVMCEKNNLYLTTPPLKRKYKMAEHTGLVVISTYPIIYNYYHIYTSHKGTCSLSNKGVQYFTINHPNLGKLNFANTHLQSSFDVCFMNYEYIAKKQLTELIQNTPFYDTIIVGDLNLETEDIINIIKNNILLKSVDGTFTNNEASYFSFPKTGKQLDYFLLYNIKPSEYKFRVNTLNLFNSDHVPIMCKIKKII